MAEWKYACKTIKGMNLDLKLAGRGELCLKLTKARSGAGKINPTQLISLQDILKPMQELQIQDAVERLGENVIRLPVILKNKGVIEKYNMHQLGVYAEDPDEGEILYIVLQSESAEEIPSSEEMKDFTLEWYLNLSVGNTQSVTVVIDESCVLTVEQADAKYVAKEEGDASGTIVEFVQAPERKEISSGEKLSAIFGKVKKYFADLKTVAFTGSYNDLINRPSIPAAVRVKGSAEETYRTGDVNITPQNIGSPSNEYMEEHFVPDYISQHRGVISSEGWYRIAQASKAEYGASCVVSVRRSYNSPAPEYQKVQLVDSYRSNKIIPLVSFTGSDGKHLFTKIRKVNDPQNLISYIEIYQNATTSRNAVIVDVEGATTVYGSPWEAIEPVPTQETVEGIDILASLDLPANFDSDSLAQKDGSNVSGIWSNLISGKALSDGDGNVIKDSYAVRKIITDGDFNEMVIPGIYTMKNSIKNAPAGTGYHALLVLQSDTGNYIEQIAFQESTFNIYVRYLTGSEWSKWERLISDGELIDKIYPIGSIYMSVNYTNPSTLFGGTWVRWGNGRVPVGLDESQSEFDTREKTGGSKYLAKHNHTTTDSNMGFLAYGNGGTIARAHMQHSGTSDYIAFTAKDVDDLGYSKTTAYEGTGSSGNLQPYITCYMWKRTA